MNSAEKRNVNDVCYLCHSHNIFKRDGKVRDNTDLSVHECSDCGLVFLSSLTHTNENHYADSGMHSNEPPAIETWLQETERDDSRRVATLREKIKGKDILDFGCGVGGFLMLAKKHAGSIAGVEPEKRLVNHFRENVGIDIMPSLHAARASRQTFDLITAFHVIEHLQNPSEVIKDLIQLLKPGGELIIEVPSSQDALLTLYQSRDFQNFTYWSQHLFLFNNGTLAKLIQNAGLHLNWIKQIQRYPLSNHLYWLSRGIPGGHVKWSFLDSQLLQDAYESQLAALGLCDTIMASVSRPHL